MICGIHINDTETSYNMHRRGEGSNGYIIDIVAPNGVIGTFETDDLVLHVNEIYAKSRPFIVAHTERLKAEAA